MRLLVLGGTKFLGRAVVDAALARGDEVTLFNRGQTSPELFPEVEKLRGDRDGDLAALERREWDAVIDPSGFVPRIVRDSAELLRGSVGHYLFVSTGSVYADPSPGFDETAPTAELTEPDSEDVLAHYGALKAACERVVAEVFPDAHTNVRAGLIVGPHDPTGRFTYWPLRVAAGGEMLAPAPPERQIQFIDVRDLAAWMVEACDRGHVGTYNATCECRSFGELLAACGDVEPVWVPDEFLVEHEVEPFSELPLWLPGEAAAFLQGDVSKAVGAGLRFRPLDATVRDTLAWAQEAGEQLVTDRGLRQGRAGLDPAKEAELLAAWRTS
ncbi:MAG TPA: NAD-dependent epimerase/dehydratase family protein [Gaiellaceae bacterium]|nr:NAD-dependent epimerase/dehydratase family protein [Gaiellaceae bacterium]